jgi:hypothetical protein
MSEKIKILVQLDPDTHPSVFDRVVAIDAGVQQLFSYGGVKPEHVQSMVHGGMFTRGIPDLRSTAFFVGGSDVAAGEAILRKVCDSFTGPFRCSVMLDANGANTTAAAAVVAARKQLDVTKTTALVLAGTGPVGRRVTRILCDEGASVRVASRSAERAAAVLRDSGEGVAKAAGEGRATALALDGSASASAFAAALDGVELVIAAGAAGITLLPKTAWLAARSVRVLIDLNAVPPAGIEGVGVMDKATEHEGKICYGAIGVGGTKMKVHKAAVASLFTSNDKVLDVSGIYELAKTLG